MCWEAVLIVSCGLLKISCMRSGRRRSPFDVNLLFPFRAFTTTQQLSSLLLEVFGWRKRKIERIEVEDTEILKQSVDRAWLKKKNGILFYSV